MERTTAIEKSDFTAKFLTEVQAQALVSVLPTTVYGLYTLVCLTLGMRPAEVRGLRWSDIELHSTGGGTVHVQQQIKDLRGAGGGYSVQPPKTKKGIRPIPIPASVVDKLCEYRHQQEVERMAMREAGLSELLPTEWADLVFRGEGGLPLNERYIRRKFKEFLASAGLDSTIRLYDMRHTNNALLAAMGIGAEVRRDMLGHSTTLITLDVYGHAMPHSKVEAMEKMDDLLTAER